MRLPCAGAVIALPFDRTQGQPPATFAFRETSSPIFVIPSAGAPPKNCVTP
jgi:hypothetical protein